MAADSDPSRQEADPRADSQNASASPETASASSEGAASPASSAPASSSEAASPAAAASAGPAGESSADLATLRAERDEANARALRYQAELDNFRKRTRREMDDQLRYATLPLINDLLSVVDNLQWALQAGEQHADNSGLLEGVKMVSRQLGDVLRQHGCVPVEAEGQAFDPHLHEAIAQEPSDSHPAGTVIRVQRGGYRLHDRVIRPAQVLVSSGPAE